MQPREFCSKLINVGYEINVALGIFMKTINVALQSEFFVLKQRTLSSLMHSKDTVLRTEIQKASIDSVPYVVEKIPVSLQPLCSLSAKVTGGQ